MRMNKKKEIFPRLRFGGYKAKWIIDSFDFEFLPTNSFSRAEMNDEKGNVKNIHYGDILTKYNDILRDISVAPFVNKNIDLSKFGEESYLKNGDIVIADTAEDFTAGKAVEVLNINFPVLAGQHTFLCRSKINFAPGFMGYCLNSPSYHNRLITLLTGTKVYSISKANIKNTFILYPENYEEQQKIADCLSSIDELINAESRKLKALEKYKKGLMQKLFPAEGKNLPEWRFPEFLNGDGWIKDSLSQICIMQAGKFINASEIYHERKNNMYPCYGGNGLRGYTLTHNCSGTYPLIGRQGAFCGNATFATGDFYATEHAIVVTANKDIDKKWLYYLLDHLQLNQYATGQAQPGLSVQMLEKVMAIYPREVKEQRKIANCLSEIDTIIAEQSNKVEQLKAHKKGLMQGLFPSLEEADV